MYSALARAGIADAGAALSWILTHVVHSLRRWDGHKPTLCRTLDVLGALTDRYSPMTLLLSLPITDCLVQHGPSAEFRFLTSPAYVKEQARFYAALASMTCNKPQKEQVVRLRQLKIGGTFNAGARGEGRPWTSPRPKIPQKWSPGGGGGTPRDCTPTTPPPTGRWPEAPGGGGGVVGVRGPAESPPFREVEVVFWEVSCTCRRLHRSQRDQWAVVSLQSSNRMPLLPDPTGPGSPRGRPHKTHHKRHGARVLVFVGGEGAGSDQQRDSKRHHTPCALRSAKVVADCAVAIVTPG